MTTAMDTLLTEVLDAHGGIDRWHTFSKVTAKVVSGGFLWAMKGIPLDGKPLSITSEFRRQRTRVEPFGEADWHMRYEPNRVVIEAQTGELVAQQNNPRETFNGHTWETPWTPLQLGYFNGYAMWTYYNLPFLLGEPGVGATEIPSIADGGSMLRGLRVRVPPSVHSHSPEQSLYFDDSGLLRRQDYEVDVAGQACCPSDLRLRRRAGSVVSPPNVASSCEIRTALSSSTRCRSQSTSLTSNSAEPGITERCRSQHDAHTPHSTDAIRRGRWSSLRLPPVRCSRRRAVTVPAALYGDDGLLGSVRGRRVRAGAHSQYWS